VGPATYRPVGLTVTYSSDPMTAHEIQTAFCRLDPAWCPELAGLDGATVFGDRMAPGGLYLAARMVHALASDSGALRPGDSVLDLGCGRGTTSRFLAERFGAHVTGVDLVVPAAERVEAVASGGSVEHLRLDARQPLPFADGAFDVIFCMQALHAIGGDVPVLHNVLRTLRPGGRFVVGTTCFNGPVTQATLPDVFRWTDGWDAQYETYRWPAWWRSLFERTGVLDVRMCEELPEGRVLWEDDVLRAGDRADWSADFLRRYGWLVDHVAYGQRHRFGLTHFVATAVKLPAPALPDETTRSEAVSWS